KLKMAKTPSTYNNLRRSARNTPYTTADTKTTETPTIRISKNNAPFFAAVYVVTVDTGTIASNANISKFLNMFRPKRKLYRSEPKLGPCRPRNSRSQKYTEKTKAYGPI